jgi:hypothetical protein
MASASAWRRARRCRAGSETVGEVVDVDEGQAQEVERSSPRAAGAVADGAEQLRRTARPVVPAAVAWARCGGHHLLGMSVRTASERGHEDSTRRW